LNQEFVMEAAATLTGPEFDALPYEEGRRRELVDGELVAVSSPTPEHQIILQRILLAMLLYFRDRAGFGMALTDVEMALAPDCRVRPDVFVLLGERAASLDISNVPISGAPDIAVEIISASERSTETQEKLETCLRHGTGEVWQVYPKSRSVVVHRPGAGAIILSSEQRLATPLLPDFVLDLSTLY
jgi:Uma2 family endonuclease